MSRVMNLILNIVLVPLHLIAIILLMTHMNTVAS